MNALPRYFALLANAHDAGAAVDQFDFDSNVPASASAFDRLLADQAAAHLELINYVITHAPTLRAQMASKL